MGRSNALQVWHYAPGVGRVVEFARPQPAHEAASLAPHVHAEMQICAVLSGRRQFMTPFGMADIRAGELAIIGAGVPHQALICPHHADVLNFYLRPRQRVWGVTVAATPAWLVEAAAAVGDVVGDWAEALAARADGSTGEPALLIRLVASRRPVGLLAADLGMSREAFSRRFRRLFGVSPQAYRGALRLIAARSALRSGAEPAKAAAEAGFADQSHLGRSFRAAFGATPAAYRHRFVQRPGSHSFQT